MGAEEGQFKHRGMDGLCSIADAHPSGCRATIGGMALDGLDHRSFLGDSNALRSSR